MLWFLFNSNRANVSSQRKHAESMSLRYGVGLLLLVFENRKGFEDLITTFGLKTRYESLKALCGAMLGLFAFAE